jgi:leader peptidase (prepilin peptidase)/N-methyltransferase
VLTLLEVSPTTLVVTAALLGLVVGSFLNVVIWRLPRMLDREWREQCAELQPGTAPAPQASADRPPGERYNLITPRSACPHCHAPIAARHNVPVLSWLWLRGRCARCAAKISARYPLLELLTGCLSALVAWRFGYGFSTCCALLVTWFLVALAAIDLDHQLLPDALTLPLLWLALLASIAPWSHGVNLPVAARDALLGAAGGYASLWLVYQAFKLATGKEGMGYGDFKLLAALGAWLGWRMLLPIVLLAATVGAMVGLTLMARRGRAGSTPLPFGPFLAAAGYVAMLWGPQGVSAYLGLYVH